MNTTHYLKIVGCVLLSVFSSTAFSQMTISGKVVDEKSSSGISNVTIYIAELQTSFIASSTGNYVISNLPQSTITLQFSCLGYATIIKKIIPSDTLTPLIITLKQTNIQTPEIVIYGTTTNDSKQTPNTISSLTQNQMRQNGAFSISDAIAQIPGINQLTTGTGISKPVIRGLYGNRIQTLLLGFRFDNQQWQDEHGLGLSDIGIDKIEIIKGPASLLYGSEAMGGVLNIIDEKNAPVGTTQSDVSTKFFSNTAGYLFDAGIKATNTKLSWKIRLGTESHADYTDGKNNRVFNSRFNGYNGKTAINFTRKNFVSQNTYQFSYSNFGFILEAEPFATIDSRWSRNYNQPHHTVLFNIIASQNTIFTPKAKIKINIGIHNNNRQEQEGGNKISLNMMLNSYACNVICEIPITEKTEISIGNQTLYQTNTNYGSRTIVPDANIFESSAFTYIKQKLFQFIFIEAGIRYDNRNIKTVETGTINTDTSNNPGKNIIPFHKQLHSLNGSAGTSINIAKNWNTKFNFSTGYRTANLAEFSSNGLHEGTLRYEIGDINLGIEQNFCKDVSLLYTGNKIQFSCAAYSNRFKNYIYLSPTNTEYLGLDIYRYIQKNATLQGTETNIEIAPLKNFSINANYSSVHGKTNDGNYLPFIPADKINATIKFNTDTIGKLIHPFLKAGSTYVFNQNTPAQFETGTPHYFLLNAGIGGAFLMNKKNLQFSVLCNNIFNTHYFDHLSRFKYFGIYNMGRTFIINLKLTIN